MICLQVGHFSRSTVRDGDAAWKMIDDVVSQHGSLDVLVNNAGGAPPADTSTASPRFTERIVALNLLSSIFTSQRANHHMQQSGGGSIVNIGSVVALRPSPTVAAYGAAKAGLLNFTITAGQEWAPKVRVNCVTAGAVRTDKAESAFWRCSKYCACGGNDSDAANGVTCRHRKRLRFLGK